MSPRAVAGDGTGIGFDVRGDGEPLVLLAGQANSRHWWSTVRGDYAAYRTVVLDTAGTGTSDDAADHDWSTRRFARDVVAVLDEAGIARAHLYGTSMGGRVAQWVAADHPGRVGALVLGCTTAGGPGAVAPDPQVLRRLADPGENGVELRRLMAGPQVAGPLPVLGDDTMSPAARAGHRRASARHDAWAAVPAITAPTLVLHGADDELTPPANGRRLADRIPGAELVVLPGARHAYFLEPRATREVLRFLAAHPLPAPPAPGAR
ncbi:alpha/beta fold hydrolase [Pseudonocardia spirodelae]|uniref:Alpha/beta fold hydrolase n=1 Tax=Pseudonocardia spirodelae TaxID=3133431 RepID=A0ABU8T218_9PSEU